ncbi:hypothetical protein ACFQH6_11680 [Halobacteriaceae archaeon GCM10025711]
MNDAQAALVSTLRTFGADDLRDVWVFDRTGERALFLRDDVAAKLADVAVEPFIDNERYGFITRDTYDRLYYASYHFTVRGFDEFEQVRTFVVDEPDKIGVLASFDRRDGGHDYAELDRLIHDLADEHGGASLGPDAGGSA